MVNNQPNVACCKKDLAGGFSFQFKPYLRGDGLDLVQRPNDWAEGNSGVKLYKSKPIQKTVDKPQ
jgi:hypothetical protein